MPCVCTVRPRPLVPIRIYSIYCTILKAGLHFKCSACDSQHCVCMFKCPSTMIVMIVIEQYASLPHFVIPRLARESGAASKRRLLRLCVAASHKSIRPRSAHNSGQVRCEPAHRQTRCRGHILVLSSLNHRVGLRFTIKTTTVCWYQGQVPVGRCRPPPPSAVVAVSI